MYTRHTATHTTSTQLQLRVTIVYDRTVRAYAMLLDDDVIGFARTRAEAEVTTRELLAELQHYLPRHAEAA